jgi:hypothetical protein
MGNDEEFTLSNTNAPRLPLKTSSKLLKVERKMF